MRRLLLLSAVLCSSACTLDGESCSEPDSGCPDSSGLDGGFVIDVDRDDAGVVAFAPRDGGFRIGFQLHGRFPMLVGTLPVRVWLPNEPASAEQTFSISPGDAGAFDINLSILAPDPGAATLSAELAGFAPQRSPEFFIPTGVVKVDWYEKTASGATGCVALVGDVGSVTLVSANDNKSQMLAARTGDCIGGALGRYALFSVAPDAGSLRFSDVDHSIQEYTHSDPPQARRVIDVDVDTDLDGGCSPTLPAEGEPFELNFRISDEDGLVQPWAPWRMEVIPAAVSALSGATDLNGRASVVLLAPKVSLLMFTIQSGAAEPVRGCIRR